MADVKDIKPTTPVKPVRRRWYAPDDEQSRQRKKQLPTGNAPPANRPDDGHIDEYA